MAKKKSKSTADGARGAVRLGAMKEHIGFQLRRAQDVSFQAFKRRVGESDLSPGHFAILSVIHENPGINQTALSHGTGRDKSTLSPTLNELEKRGFVSRKRSSIDRRASVLGLTKAGRAHLAALAVHAKAHDRALDALVGELHKPLLLHLLERIVTGLETRTRDDKSRGD